MPPVTPQYISYEYADICIPIGSVWIQDFGGMYRVVDYTFVDETKRTISHVLLESVYDSTRQLTVSAMDFFSSSGHKCGDYTGILLASGALFGRRFTRVLYPDGLPFCSGTDNWR